MAALHVLDDYYLAITALITVGYQLSFFAIAYTCKFDKLTDFAGGSNFIILAIVTISLSHHHQSRQLVVTLFLIAWAVRLTSFLFFRILKTGKDDRFDEMRQKFFPFLGFWILQMLWVWTVSLPVTVLNSPAVTRYPQHSFGTGRDIVGIVMYSIGLMMETVSDAQKYRFRSKHDSQAVCDKGLFAVSRHPNYFGEIIVHFAIYMIAVSSAADGFVRGQAYKALYATILGPFFLTFLLLFVSGISLSERPKAKARYESGNNWQGYKRWLDRTSVLIPFPPQLYEKMPTILKRTVFLEFPMYVFDPKKHSSAPPPERTVSEGRGEPVESSRDDSPQSGEEQLI
ncbi:hypothetical protein M441DRAFT_60950 [Trichoderma asperellum CBS 433.97]|uniref:Steroid 5-alpha reductase C-terminal domain-containing protein n=1 Tax=Trichoderma asperellum (strain ATCC 204424 / CBS 433.97 / NBRC 101777) TaxID=1042311 RepID=A0A2T3YYZ4_TRIA4|nr:hypothetical protein M441DRAFT_60950 [Trichoderma asperellum CBS 433.97]PTB37791.1 hypothetical protein M441DRAFT_60950 [Trichoderma asperellum CBS 433.97]